VRYRPACLHVCAYALLYRASTQTQREVAVAKKKKGRGVGRREDRLACVCARMQRQSLKARQGKLLHVRVQLPPPINHLERDRERERE
jgi:hypothetical protein